MLFKLRHTKLIIDIVLHRLEPILDNMVLQICFPHIRIVLKSLTFLVAKE